MYHQEEEEQKPNKSIFERRGHENCNEYSSSQQASLEFLLFSQIKTFGTTWNSEQE